METRVDLKGISAAEDTTGEVSTPFDVDALFVAPVQMSVL